MANDGRITIDVILQTDEFKAAFAELTATAKASAGNTRSKCAKSSQVNRSKAILL